MSEKLLTIKNISKEDLCFAGIAKLAPGETREVPEELARLLMRNESIELVEDKKSSKKMKGVESEK